MYVITNPATKYVLLYNYKSADYRALHEIRYLFEKKLMLDKTGSPHVLSVWGSNVESPIRHLKVPKCEICDPFFYINKSYMGRWLEDWRIFLFFAKTTGDIRHFVFFAQAEPALKIQKF